MQCCAASRSYQHAQKTTDHFSGHVNAAGRLCVCVCVCVDNTLVKFIVKVIRKSKFKLKTYRYESNNLNDDNA